MSILFDLLEKEVNNNGKPTPGLNGPQRPFYRPWLLWVLLIVVVVGLFVYMAHQPSATEASPVQQVEDHAENIPQAASQGVDAAPQQQSAVKVGQKLSEQQIVQIQQHAFEQVIPWVQHQGDLMVQRIHEIGDLLEESGDNQGAYLWYSQWVDTGDVSSIVHAAQYQLILDNLQQAEAIIDKINPEVGTVDDEYFVVKAALALKLKHYEQASQYYNYLIKIHTDNADYFLGLALSEMGLGNMEQAKYHLTMAKHLAPPDWRFHAFVMSLTKKISAEA